MSTSNSKLVAFLRDLTGREQPAKHLKDQNTAHEVSEQYEKMRRAIKQMFRKEFPLGTVEIENCILKQVDHWVADEPVKIFASELSALESCDAMKRDRLEAEHERELQERQNYLFSTFNSQTAERERKHTNEIERLKENHRSELERREHNLSLEYAGKLSRMTWEKDQKIRDNRMEFKSEISEWKNHIAGLKTRHEEEKEALVLRKDEEVFAKSEESRVIIARRDEQIVELNDRIRRNQEDHTAEIESEKAEHLQRHEMLTWNHATQVENLKQDFKAREASTHAEMMQARQLHATALSDQQDDYEKQISALRTSMQAQAQTMEQDYQAKTAGLRQQLQDLNDALMHRDDSIYQGGLFHAPDGLKTDRQLQADFQNIQRTVEELGRLGWNQSQTLWPDGCLMKAYETHGRRLVRKAILQDCIWTALYRHIFASPFRVFGEAGSSLEEEWSEQCGSGGYPFHRYLVISADPPTESQAASRSFDWPEPSVCAERWRYMTIKDCLEALRKPLPSEFDCRSKLRQGFTDTSSEFVEGLHTSLSAVIESGPELRECLGGLFKKAAAMWLEFGKHRCRIVVRHIEEPVRSMSDKAGDLARGGSICLLMVPELGRFGNAKGLDLTEFTIIGDRKGESLDIS